jgi:hypothetical protein
MSGFATEPSDRTTGNHETAKALDGENDFQRIIVEPAHGRSFLE